MYKKVPMVFFGRKMTLTFLISHIIGWLLANIQTIWIVFEIRRAIKIIKKKVKFREVEY
ncbi:hypothetical protein [Cytobacillus firmus]|uniref:hypothetical protein n=1 Tax=Cytobacillus firmus TaxID=1399 RepID=UPI00222842B1|nr:hypothetical protein [Cytobacillus firmus]